jgi:LysM repeat protein
MGATLEPATPVETAAVSLACCPFLRLKDDPDSRALYANAEHRCFARSGSGPRISTVEPRHQEQLCLSQQFPECPRYGQSLVPKWNTASKRGRVPLPLIVGMSFLLAAALAANLAWSGGGPLVGRQSPPTSANLMSTQSSTEGRLAVDPSPTSLPMVQPGDRTSCDEIRETQYRSDAERAWYLRNCLTPTPTITTPSAVRGSIFHRVAPGDTLEALARTYGVPVEAVMRANDLQSSLILVGATLVIPLGQTPTTPIAPTPIR